MSRRYYVDIVGSVFIYLLYFLYFITSVSVCLHVSVLSIFLVVDRRVWNWSAMSR